MSSRSNTNKRQSVAQIVDGLHPNFVNLRFAAKDIEQDINLDQMKIRPIEMLLNLAKAQVKANPRQAINFYPSPTN